MTETYKSPTFELYECSVCKKRYQVQVGTSITDNPHVKLMQHFANMLYGSEGGCCTVGTMTEIKDEGTQDQS